VLEERFQRIEKRLGDLAESVVLIEHREQIPARVGRAAHELGHRLDEGGLIAGAARERLEPIARNMQILMSAQWGFYRFRHVEGVCSTSSTE
jgi:hypothetical protein